MSTDVSKKKRCHNDWLTLDIIVFIDRLDKKTIPERSHDWRIS